MKIKILLPFASLLLLSCNKSFISATLSNTNVYKTKAPLVVKKAYFNGSPAIDQRDFTINPNPNDSRSITKMVITETTYPKDTFGNSIHTLVTVTSTIPSSIITTTEIKDTVNGIGSKIENSTVSFTTPSENFNSNFIRYRVLFEQGDYKYLKILPGCRFSGNTPFDTLIVFGESISDTLPENYIFQVATKSLNPNNHYLASSFLMGKITSLPGRIRNEYWNNNNKSLQGALSIGYTFGWKTKIYPANNPYKNLYLNIIPYGFGISSQKYFSIVESTPSEKADEFAITYFTAGLALEFNSKFNVGIFAGKDKMLGNKKNWAFQDKWWWGIGIGYELFK